MTVARRQLIDPDSTPYYHIICRCVRRAYLCGKDKLTGQDFSHRRQWIEDKLLTLFSIFTIDIAAYAIMSNHYHLVLRIDSDAIKAMTDNEVIKQYSTLHKPALIIEQFSNGETLTEAQLHTAESFIKIYRERLSSISWFMKILNQSIALQANREDKVTGKFWESRFKSQALLDTEALLTCMAYVDLNPIRANVAQTPESSDFTSIQTRLDNNIRPSKTIRKHLLGFKTKNEDYGSKNIPITQAAYIELVDWTGRIIRDDKRGFIPSNIPPILERLNLTEHQWLRQTRYFEARFKRAAGTWESIQRFASNIGKVWCHGKPPKPKLNLS